MSAIILGGGILLLGALAFAGKGRRGRAVRNRETPRNVCAMTPDAVARETSRDALFAWLECDGRSVADAAALARRLRLSGRASDADATEARWNAIREVIAARPDGQLSPEGARDVDAAARGTVTLGEIERTDTPRGTMEMGEPTLIRSADARRLVSGTIAALRRRTNYRAPLREFQRAAGLVADGQYGPRSYNALRYFGGDPPSPFIPRPAVDSAEAAYPPQV